MQFNNFKMTIFINLKFEPSLEYLLKKIMSENVILKITQCQEIQIFQLLNSFEVLERNVKKMLCLLFTNNRLPNQKVIRGWIFKSFKILQIFSISISLVYHYKIYTIIFIRYINKTEIRCKPPARTDRWVL